ncbi:hypothetical protein CXQ82_11465 [Pseudomonas sp. S09G 359]|nr:hypothetical protein CXQ82_11465 [Pseudomonas sp. S09G 359]
MPAQPEATKRLVPLGQAVCRAPKVGAGLLANAVYQLTHVYLMHRIREQARSHIFDLSSA